jgi:hypothetical protein
LDKASRRHSKLNIVEEDLAHAILNRVIELIVRKGDVWRLAWYSYNVLKYKEERLAASFAIMFWVFRIYICVKMKYTLRPVATDPVNASIWFKINTPSLTDHSLVFDVQLIYVKRKY